MLSKSFLSSAIAVLAAAGAIATPVVSARTSDPRFPQGFDGVVTPFSDVCTSTGTTKPSPKKAPVFPSAGAVPESTTELEVRDIVSSYLLYHSTSKD
jgi:hypothetical protein